MLKATLPPQAMIDIPPFAEKSFATYLITTLCIEVYEVLPPPFRYFGVKSLIEQQDVGDVVPILGASVLIVCVWLPV